MTSDAPTRYLNTVYVVDYDTKLHLRKGSLTASTPNGQHRIPMNAVEAVVMFNGQITTNAIAECVQRGIRVAVLKRSGHVQFTAGGPTTGNVHLRIAQVDASRDEATARRVASIIVAAKITNSAALARRWSTDAQTTEAASKAIEATEKLTAVLNDIDPRMDRDSLRGMEGDAARAYFSAMASHLRGSGWTFSGRNRRPPRDPVNALLSFCYGMLSTEYKGACDAVGLDPQIGFLHQALRPGRPSMALDLMEEARTLTDRFVVSVLKRKQLSPGCFETALGDACYLTDDGRRTVLDLWEADKNREFMHPLLMRKVARWALPTIQATMMARWLRGDLPDYPPFLARR